MDINKIKKIGVYLIPVIVFILISTVYFSPVLKGKALYQYDIANAKGMSKEINDFREKYHSEALWTNSMFGGMPAYLISLTYKYDFIKYIRKVFEIFPSPINFLFLALFAAYIALLLMGANIWIATIGAIAYAFSSYFIIIIGVGHTSKMLALGYMPMVIAGVWYTFNKKILIGSSLSGVFLALQLASNHPQITYYTLIILVILFFIYLPLYIKRRQIKNFMLASLALFIAAVLAIGTSAARLWTTYEYGKYSMRGKSELTINAENKTSGLDKDYATAWSYGKIETFNLLIPNLMGGSSHDNLGQNSNFYKILKENGVREAKQILNAIPAYWGGQSFTSGPVYIGAIIVFLFFFGLFLLKGPLKWWLAICVIISFILAWGRNITVGELLKGGSFFTGAVLLIYFFENKKELSASKQKSFLFSGIGFMVLFLALLIVPSNKLFDTIFNYLVLDYLPGYNKFRTVSMTLVIAEFAMPFLAAMALQKISENNISKVEFFKAFRWAAIITGGICLIFIIIPQLFLSFDADFDQQLISAGWPADIIEAIKKDRKALTVNDALRSLFFISVAAVTLLLLFFKKIKKQYAFLIIAVFVLIDMWTIDRRYLNDNNFVTRKKAVEPFTPSNADLFIMKDVDPNFRVYNLTVSTFNDASTSYFHKSIGGYHGAKMKRYQELIDFHLSKGNMAVLNMLNTKYFIVKDNNGQPVPQINFQALGNAWFVDTLRWVPNADSEILALNNFNPAKEAIIDIRYKKYFDNFKFRPDSGAAIKLTQYKPNHLIYESYAIGDQLAVFSEIFYDKGWNAYIDGKPIGHFRVNYVLRSMIVPSGKHTIEFKFEPKSYYMGDKISLASFILLMIFLISALYVELKKVFKK